jgi:hypothetical protein
MQPCDDPVVRVATNDRTDTAPDSKGPMALAQEANDARGLRTRES